MSDHKKLHDFIVHISVSRDTLAESSDEAEKLALSSLKENSYSFGCEPEDIQIAHITDYGEVEG